MSNKRLYAVGDAIRAARSAIIEAAGRAYDCDPHSEPWDKFCDCIDEQLWNIAHTTADAADGRAELLGALEGIANMARHAIETDIEGGSRRWLVGLEKIENFARAALDRHKGGQNG